MCACMLCMRLLDWNTPHIQCKQEERLALHKKELLQLTEKISKLDEKLDEVAKLPDKRKKAEETGT